MKYTSRPRGILAMEEIKPTPRTVQLTLSVEGLFDGLLSMFKKKHDEKPIQTKHSFEWSYEYANAINSTYGNKAWVEENFRPTHKISAETTNKLMYKGKTFTTPLETLEQGKKIAEQFFQQHKAQGDRYFKAIGEAINAYKAEPSGHSKEGMSEETVNAYLNRVNKITPVFSKSFIGPEWFQGTFAISKEPFAAIKLGTPAAPVNGLAQITADDVVAAAQFIVNYVKENHIWDDSFYDYTSGVDHHFYKALSDDAADLPAAHELAAKLGSDVEAQHYCFFIYTELMNELINAVGRWLIQVTTAHTKTA